MKRTVRRTMQLAGLHRFAGGSWLGLGAALLVAALIAAPARGQGGSTSAKAPVLPSTFKLYDTRYYKMYTDLDQERVREVTLRMDAMAEEYHARTSDFAGAIREKLPFYLFKEKADYLAAGGPPDTAGVFKSMTMGGMLIRSSGRLMAIAGEKITDRTWHVIQHEGFHQFAAYVIQGQMPVWANEGLAEYFGEAVFTGDGFVSGTLPPWRVDRVKKELEEMKDFDDLLRLSHEGWNKEMSTNAVFNYDQAWSLVYFLVQADKGKYRQPFVGFINCCAHGTKGEPAWVQNFGADAEAAQKQWKKFWTELPADAGADTQTRITVSTLTSFLARASLQKQTFANAGAFFEAAQAGQLKCAMEQWLPPSLLARSLSEIEKNKLSGWSLGLPASHPSLVLKTANGKTFTGKYSGEDKVKVTVAVQDEAATAKPPTGAKPSGSAQSATSARPATH